jgi:hypothetical protein
MPCSLIGIASTFRVEEYEDQATCKQQAELLNSYWLLDLLNTSTVKTDAFLKSKQKKKGKFLPDYMAPYPRR